MVKVDLLVLHSYFSLLEVSSLEKQFVRGVLKMTKLFGPYKKMNKSASMQLSINAIVILVMAMSVLGLGLGIINGVRNQKDKLLDVDVDLSATADSGSTITNFKAEESMTVNKEKGYAISFYNSKNECEDTKVDVWCNAGTPGAEDVNMIVRQKGKPSAVGDPVQLQFALTPNSERVEGELTEGSFESGTNYFCDLIVYCGDNSGTYLTAELDRFPFSLDI